jgi:hypothetical protein
MQNLFEFNQLTGYIALNKPWISMVPEFKDILVKSKPVRGDMDGRKKIHAFRIFTFIYMLVDFKSPLRDMTDEERYKEALRCSELVETDITEQVKKATAIYELYQENCARSLRTLKSMRRSLDQLDKYFETIDFTKTDKKGELLHSAKEYQANMKGVKDTYQSYEEFEERVHKELMAEATVRGDRKLGGKEGKRTSWEEGKRPDVAAARMLELVNDIFGKSVDIEDDEDPGSSFPEIEEDEIPNQQEEEE